MQIPHSDTLTTARLGKIYSNTVATYKFFWFLSILQIHARTGNLRINVWDIVIRMVANAWYPVKCFKLSFGNGDSLPEIIAALERWVEIPEDADAETVVERIKASLGNIKVKKHLRILLQAVPYRFLSPWISTADKNLLIERSQALENGCLYSLTKEAGEMFVEINPAWDIYLHSHFNILCDFTYWNLVQFLQNRNPNVPAIPNKLIRTEERNSLSNQHRFWDAVLTIGGPQKCIYTGRLLRPDDYALDHFIPWSFVSHDLLWNLIPADSSINSSKSNHLPDLGIYLPKMATMQQHSLRIALRSGRKFPVLEDYLSLGHPAAELAEMSGETFCEILKKTITPLNQIAQNMGFETWRYNTSTP